MIKMMKVVAFAASIILCLSAPAFAQERFGAVEGTVKDSTGAVVPNATVRIQGNAFDRTVTSDAEGFFRVQQVPPGTNYTVTIGAGNFKPFVQNNVIVQLGQATPIDAALSTTVEAVVEVTSDDGIASIDATTSKIQTNLDARKLETLPKGNNFTTALKAAAPVREEMSAGGFQIDGASGSENSFVVDGQDVTNFRSGSLNMNNNIPFQMIEEVQVKSNGYEAEYGGATGGVINVVTKRGSDDFHGDIGAAFDVSALDAGPRRILNASVSRLPSAFNRYIYPKKDDNLGFFPSVTVSGPILKKRLFFFASHSPQYFDIRRNYTFTDGGMRRYNSEVQNDYSFVRLDAQISDKLQVSSNYLYNPMRTRGVLPTFASLDGAGPSTSAAAPDAVAQGSLGGRIPATNFGVSGTYVPTQNLSIDIRFGRGYLNEKLNNYGIPQATNYVCGDFPCLLGNAGARLFATNSPTVKDISIRNGFDATAGLYLNNFGGRHNFRFGYQYTGLSNDVDDGNVGFGTLTFHIDPTAQTFDQNGCPRPNRIALPGCPIDGPEILGYGQLSLVGRSGKVSSKNEALFAQDSWQIGGRLTLNLGIRIEKENVPTFREGNPGIQFEWNDKMAPRIGVAYDILGNGKWKVFGSYGRFFDRFKYELPRGSFGGEVQDIYDFLVSSPNIYQYTRAGVIANHIRFQDQRTPSNLASDNRIDPNLKPFQQAEFTAGTAYDFGRGFILEGRYTHKNIIRAIDDIGFLDLDDNEQYFIGNPGEGVCARPACGRYEIPNAFAPKAKRVYDAMEVRVQKRFGQFAFDANYTFSRLFGNYTGSASSDEAQRAGGAGRNSPAVSRYFDLPFMGFTLDGTLDDGPLPTDRPHFAKVAATYRFEWFGSKTNATDFNLFYQIGSGTPVTTRARYGVVSGMIVSKRGDLGRTDTLSQTDLSLTHKYRFGRDLRFGVAFDVTALNLWNQATEISRRETITRSEFSPGVIGCPTADPNDTPVRCLTRAVFNGGITSASFLAYANATVNGDPNARKDLRYNLPQLFQNPRAFRFGVRFLF